MPPRLALSPHPFSLNRMTINKAEQERERSEGTRQIEAAKREQKLRQSQEDKELTARLEAEKQQQKDKDATS